MPSQKESIPQPKENNMRRISTYRRNYPVFTKRWQDENTTAMYGLTKLFTIKFPFGFQYSEILFSIQYEFSFCFVIIDGMWVPSGRRGGLWRKRESVNQIKPWTSWWDQPPWRSKNRVDGKFVDFLSLLSLCQFSFEF